MGYLSILNVHLSWVRQYAARPCDVAALEDPVESGTRFIVYIPMFSLESYLVSTKKGKDTDHVCTVPILVDILCCIPDRLPLAREAP